MAALGEVRFGRHDGSVDATPVFVVLAGRSFESTGDRALVDELWPHFERDLYWMDTDGDSRGDGFFA
jgi:glycogen debranching enzyme